MRWHEIIIESANPSWLGIDNPGGDWLESTKAKCHEHPKGIRSNPTGYTRKPILISTSDLMDVEGYNGEHKIRTTSDKFKALQAKVDVSRFNNKDHPILVAVNVDGKPYIMEGNHRAAVAYIESIPAIWANVQWYGGSEALEGAWSPASLHSKWSQLSSRPIEEAFEAKEVTWQSKGPAGAQFKFNVGGQDFSGQFYTNSQRPGHWHFAFTSLASPELGQTRASVDNTGAQGARSLQVFGYVVSAMEEFIRDIEPEELTFGADKSIGKDGLYLSMAKRLKNRVTQLGYRIGYEEKHGATYFTIEKIN